MTGFENIQLFPWKEVEQIYGELNPAQKVFYFRNKFLPRTINGKYEGRKSFLKAIDRVEIAKQLIYNNEPSQDAENRLKITVLALFFFFLSFILLYVFTLIN